MKTKASMVLKHLLSVLTSLAKSKSAALKSKTSAAKSRLMMFSFMQKKLISNKIHNLLNHKKTDSEYDEDYEEDQSKAIVLYNNKGIVNYMSADCADSSTSYVMEKNESSEWDLLDEGDPNRSVIDLVKDSKEGPPEDFSLEDEIDEVADLFIKRFHKQIRLQKLESFKRFQAMLERGL